MIRWYLSTIKAQLVILKLHAVIISNHLSLISTIEKNIAHRIHMENNVPRRIDLHKQCHSCKTLANFLKTINARLHSIISISPFLRWGLNFIGPITLVTKFTHNKYILVARNCSTKWAKAKAIHTNMANVMTHF